MKAGFSNAIARVCAVLLLPISGAVLSPARAAEPPVVGARANAPGWITVIWEHTGEGVYRYDIQRQNPPYSDGSTVLVAQSVNRTDSVTDKGLQADTLYKYRVCAVYASATQCSQWVAERTMPPPAPPAQVSLAPPTVTGGESFHEPSRIRISWKKNGNYNLVLVRWWHKTTDPRAAQQVDVESRAFDSREVSTPVPGTYVFLLKGCNRGLSGRANCGEWSAPVEIAIAPPPPLVLECTPGMLKAGSPRFEASGRAEYHFEHPRPGYTFYKTPAGVCLVPARLADHFGWGHDFVVASYLVHGIWNPTAKPGAWDKSGANTMETFTLTLGGDLLKRSRSPRLPDAQTGLATVSFLVRAHCDRDPWLNENANCRRTGDNVPQDIREKWPAIVTGPFPHSRNAIAPAERRELLAHYQRVTANLVGTARPPGVDPAVLAPRSAQTTGGQTPRVTGAAPKSGKLESAGPQTSASTAASATRLQPGDPATSTSQALPPTAMSPTAPGTTGPKPQAGGASAPVNPQSVPPKWTAPAVVSSPQGATPPAPFTSSALKSRTQPEAGAAPASSLRR
jgi:hypothetical protein